MKNKALIIGGAAAIAGYFLFVRGKGTSPAATSPKKPGGFYLPPLTTSGGLSEGEQILRDPSQLEGYFSTGAFTGPAVGPVGRKHRHKSPCCRNCASGRPCSG